MVHARPFRAAPALLVFGLLFAFGCAPGRYVNTPRPLVELDRYETLEVAPVVSEQDAVEITDESLAEIRERFVKKFDDDKLMHRVVEATPESAGVCQVRCSITKFNKGSSAGRFFIGFGVGRASMTIHVALLDKASQAVLGETDVSGTVAADFWNRVKAEGASRQLAGDISKFIKQRGQGGKAPKTPPAPEGEKPAAAGA